MKLIVVLTIAATLAGAANAFTPSSKNKVASSNEKKVMSPNSRVRVEVATTLNNMVSMSSPFWNTSPSRSAASSSKAIVDRDYTVAATLLMVGIMLGLFHPSEYSPSFISCLHIM